MLEYEKIGLNKITFYPSEIYALHYKDKPFTISKISLKEQWELGVRYASKGTTTRKCYFTAGHAKTGSKLLPKSIRDQVEIVKYVPEQDYNELKEKVNRYFALLERLRKNELLDKIEIGNTSCTNCLNKINLNLKLMADYGFEKDYIEYMQEKENQKTLFNIK